MPLKTHTDEQPTLNLTPMIDIVFLLIIFFMVGTKFTELERQIGLNLAEVSNSESLTSRPSRRVINVYPDGAITLDRQSITLSDLLVELTDASSQYADLGVLVRGDSDARHQNVVDVLHVCKRANIRNLDIAVRPIQP